VQLIFGGFVQILHFVIVPETRSDILLDREAKRRREQDGQKHIYGPTDFKHDRFSRKAIITTWVRPFHMFVREPIVLCCSRESSKQAADSVERHELTSSAFGLRRFTHLHFPRSFPPDLRAIRLLRPADGLDIRSHRYRIHHRLGFVSGPAVQAASDPPGKFAGGARAPTVVATLPYVLLRSVGYPSSDLQSLHYSPSV